MNNLITTRHLIATRFCALAIIAACTTITAPVAMAQATGTWSFDFDAQEPSNFTHSSSGLGGGGYLYMTTGSHTFQAIGMQNILVSASSTATQSASASITVPMSGSTCMANCKGPNGQPAPPASGVEFSRIITWNNSASAAAGSAVINNTVVNGSASASLGFSYIPGDNTISLPTGVLQAASPIPYPFGSAKVVSSTDNTNLSETISSSQTDFHSRSGSVSIQSGNVVWGMNSDSGTGVDILSYTWSLDYFRPSNGTSITLAGWSEMPGTTASAQSQVASGASAGCVATVVVTGSISD